MIEVHALGKRFESVAALDDLSFVAPNGAITGLVGVNGAGKTTTLNIICGLIRADSGEVRIDQRQIPSYQELYRMVGALLDHQGLYPRLTVRENITYFAELHGMQTHVRQAETDRIIELLGLTPVADRRAAVLSRGERVKVALARAIVHSPQNLILDEPTNGLDVLTVRAFQEMLRSLRGEGKSIIISSHALHEMKSLCDYIVVLHRGRVVANGPVDRVCEQAGAATLEDAFLALTSPGEAQ